MNLLILFQFLDMVDDKTLAAASTKAVLQHYIDFFGFHWTRTLRITSDALLCYLSFLWINLVMQRRKIIGSHKSEDEITALNYLNTERNVYIIINYTSSTKKQKYLSSKISEVRRLCLLDCLYVYQNRWIEAIEWLIV